MTETLGSFYRAGNLMVYPPISIGVDQTLKEAREMLTKFSINVLLVVDKEARIIGFISEHSVAKALCYGLLDFPVSAFMNTEFLTVKPDSSFNEVKRIIINLKQRILPVMDNDRPVGVITRTDVLHVLAEESSKLGLVPNVHWDNRRNLTSLMGENLSLLQINILKKISFLADKLGSQLYAVGGCVRDIIMRKPIHDLDLALDGDLDDFVGQVAQVYRLTKVISHQRFKTATLHTIEGLVLDISTTRREHYEYPGALPVIQTSSLRLDLYRRDFTINSLAVVLNVKNFGELLDFYRGYQDIKSGCIRVLHNLSFVEDPTRAFRAVRFEARLGFKISKMTANLLEGAVRNNFLTSLDRRRLLHELKLILSEDDPGPAIQRLDEFGLLSYIHSKIVLPSRCHLLFTRFRQVRDWLILTFPERKSQTWFIYLLALIEGLKKHELMELASSLTFKKKEAQILITELPVALELLVQYKYSSRPIRPSQASDLFVDLSWIVVVFIIARTENMELAQAGMAFLTIYQNCRPFLNGWDLLELGLPQGPAINRGLNFLRRAKLDGLVKTRVEEINFIQHWWDKERNLISLKSGVKRS
ncbi:MAG: CBS domain-containing protein [Candidatus Adiutrix intracellularis]|jgi:tRNA nucleotidyltransferase (CCA-adding enzyme)|nr:CBS domain-containing protein [Candidatus Adiutrix intracellularis]